MPESYTGRVEIGGEKQGAERRRAPRFERVFELSYQVVALPDEQTLIETLDRLLMGESRDLSEVGISKWTNKLLMPGSTIEMAFPAPPGEHSVRVRARVVWCQPHTDGGVVKARAGLEFLNVDSATREKLVRIIREGAG